MGDLIAAVATAPGLAGIAIVRISGEGARELLCAVTGSRRPEDRRIFYTHVRGEDGEEIDEVMAVFMAAPRTYTREDTAEIYCHGGYRTAQSVLGRVFRAGARPAQSGEFTRRAFENGRIDLSQAEAVMQLVGAESERAERCALRQLDGAVGSFVRDVSEKLTDVMARIEASMDFPEEISEEEAASDIRPRVVSVLEELKKNIRLDNARLLNDGARIVIAGRPNVGKSSLMNRLIGHERAIVTGVPGTTRDVVTEDMMLAGVKVSVSDTAGIRNAGDEAEKIGVDMAKKALRSADVVLCVTEAGGSLSEEDAQILLNAGERAIPVVNKCDLPRALPEIKGEIAISCVTGEGIDALLSAMEEKIRGQIAEDACLVTRRHTDCAVRASEALERALCAIDGGMPLDAAAMDIRDALNCICEITGESAQEDVIDRVFRDFCVGK